MKMENMLNHVYKPCEEFEKIYFKKGFFFQERHNKYVVIEIMTNNHIQMVGDKHN
jgi:uncharacterized LabA/DUF88 family protein